MVSLNFYFLLVHITTCVHIIQLIRIQKLVDSTYKFRPLVKSAYPKK